MLIERIYANRLVIREKLSARMRNPIETLRARHWNRATASVHGRGVRAFWWTGTRNFGDLITPLLLREYGMIPILSKVRDAEVVSTGSILESVATDYDGIILGSGMLTESSQSRSFPHAQILAVRGALTRNRIKAPANTPLGDPGILIVDTMKRRSQKTCELGIVPHYEDMRDPRIHSLVRRHHPRVKWINVLRGPAVVAREIDQCQRIVSSSLHGCVVADSLGIPNRWVVFSDRVVGSGFKFRDYYSAFDSMRTPLTVGREIDLEVLLQATEMLPIDVIKEVKGNLRDAFGVLARHIAQVKRSRRTVDRC